MRKIITLNDIVLAFPGAVIYGYAYAIPELMGFNEWICLAVCLGAGIPLEMAFEKVLWHKKVQQYELPRKLFLGGCLVFYAIMTVLSVQFFEYSLRDDLAEELFIWSIGVPIIICAVKALWRWRKNKQLERAYADGSGGIKLDEEAISYIRSLNGKNEKLSEAPDGSFPVKTRTGVYCGEKSGKTVCYLGIPYAQAPVGALRWKAPVPLPSSDEIWEATHFGDSAPQDISHKLALLTNRAQSEDCLTLNVWKSLKAPEGEPLHVVAYIHGGEFCYGGSANPLCEGEEYVKDHPDVLFVSINYRLGLLGFLNTEGIEGGWDYPDAANLGLLDQIAALRWIRENIAAFGGDPESVTLMGHDAGATSAVLLSVCDQAKGLFKRAIIASPCYAFLPDGGAHSRRLAQRFMELTGFHTMGDLQRLSTKTLIAAGEALYKEDYLFAPTLDGTLLPENVYQALHAGDAEGISFVVGLALNEATKTLLDYNAAVHDHVVERYADAAIAGAPAGKVKTGLKALLNAKVQETGSLWDGQAAFMEEWGFRIPLTLLARSITQAGGSMWAFSWEIGSSVENFMANSIPCIATLLDTRITAQKLGYLVNDDAQELIQAVIAKFIRGETPDLYFEELHGFGCVSWPKATPSSLPLLEITPKKVQCVEYSTLNRENTPEELLAYRATTANVAMNFVV